MSDQQNVDKGRRNLLIATSVAGGVGGVAVAAPFVCTFAPSEKARAAGAPVEADVSDLAPGQMKVVEWRGKPVWLLKRTPDMLESLKKTDNEVADPKSDVPFTMKTPDYCKNETRSRAEHKACWSWSASVPILVAPRLVRFPRAPTCNSPQTPASSARATAPRSTWLAACSRTSPRRRTSTFRRTCSCPTRSW